MPTHSLALRQVLLQNGVDLYNNGAKVINCHGIGTCGKSAVEIKGEVSQAKKARHNGLVRYLPILLQ